MSATPRLDAIRAHRAGDVDTLLALALDVSPRHAVPRSLADWPANLSRAQRLATIVRCCASGAAAVSVRPVVIDRRSGRTIPPPPPRPEEG